MIILGLKLTKIIKINAIIECQALLLPRIRVRTVVIGVQLWKLLIFLIFTMNMALFLVQILYLLPLDTLYCNPSNLAIWNFNFAIHNFNRTRWLVMTTSPCTDGRLRMKPFLSVSIVMLGLFQLNLTDAFLFLQNNNIFFSECKHCMIVLVVAYT